MQSMVDEANAEFWNELCGTHLAQFVDVNDRTSQSLLRFDEAYFRLYPYLLPIVQPERMVGRSVLEIGLGFGTLGQRIAAGGADYRGLDISPGPVAMMNHRLSQAKLHGRATQGSALDIPFASEYFDFVVSIGCLHHTGDIRRSFSEVHRVLKPGGLAVLMLYNKYSYRQWLSAPLATFRELLSVNKNLGESPERIDSDRRKLLDFNTKGQAAPETVLLSVSQLKTLLSCFDRLSFAKHTGRPMAQSYWNPKAWIRPIFLSTVGRVMGMDIYIEAQKSTVVASELRVA